MTKQTNMNEAIDVQNYTLKDTMTKEAIMEDASGEQQTSFKDAFMKTCQEEGIGDAVWADLLQEDFPEDKWYKEAEEDISDFPKYRVLLDQ